jgi:hypothetical protein
MLTPEEELELAEIQKERESLQMEYSSIDEELKKLQAPEPVEPQVAAPVEEKGILDRIQPVIEEGLGIAGALSRGVAQGFTNEFADEGLAKLTGTSKEEMQQDFEQSEKERPITTGIGNLIGGVAQGAALSTLTGGAGAPAAVASTLAKVNSLSKLLKNTAKGLSIGSTMGALTSAGASKKTLEEQRAEGFKEAKEGAKGGAVVGGTLSGVAGTIGAGVTKVADKISKAIDEGKYPAVARLVRQGWRSGKEGKGFSGEINKDKYVDEAYDIAENVVRPKITSTLTDLREVRDYIVENSEGTIDLSIPVQTLNAELKKIGFQEADLLRKGIEKNFRGISSKGYITLADANRFAKTLQDEMYNKPELSSQIKKVVFETQNSIKNMVKDRIPARKAVEVLSKNPAQLEKYRKYVSNLPDSEMAEMLSTQARLSPEQALDKAKEIKDTLKVMGEVFKDEDPEIIGSIMLDPKIKNYMDQILKVTHPVKVLDSKMSKILESSKILGEVTTGKGEAEMVDDVIKIFKNIITQPKDGQSAYLAKKKYEKSMELLREAIPELADVIDSRIKPALADLELQRYIEGAGFDQSVKDSGILRKVIGDVGRLGTQAANITSQTLQAARKGEAGPITGIPTSTMLKPAISTLNSLKTKIDFKLESSPNNKVYQFFSKSIDEAIQNQDEGRRIAVLNILNQYAPIREMLKETEEEQKSP